MMPGTASMEEENWADKCVEISVLGGFPHVNCRGLMKFPDAVRLPARCLAL